MMICDRRMKMKKLAYDEVHELLEYRDSELYWKPRPLSMFGSQRDCNGWNSRNAGNRAGGYQAKGYRSLSVHGVIYLCHRVVWLMERGRWPKRHLKFKDGDRSNIDITNTFHIIEHSNLCLISYRSIKINRG